MKIPRLIQSKLHLNFWGNVQSTTLTLLFLLLATRLEHQNYLIPFIYSVILASFIGLRNSFLSLLILTAYMLEIARNDLIDPQLNPLWHLENMLQPVSAFFTSAILGGLADHRRDQAVFSEQTVTDLIEVNTNFEQIHETLRERNAKLEERLADALHLSASFLERSIKLGSTSDEEKPRELVRCISEQLWEEDCALYEFVDHELRLIGSRITSPLIMPQTLGARELDGDFKLVSLALREDRLVKPEELVGDGMRLIALPVHNPLGQTVAVLIIPRLSFLNYHSETFTILSIMGRWLGAHL